MVELNSNRVRTYFGKTEQTVSDGWCFVSEESLWELSNPHEINSPPMTVAKGFPQIDKVCQILLKHKALVNPLCGLHVHVYAKDLSDEQLLHLFNIYKEIESEIDSKVDMFRVGGEYCKPVRNKTFEEIKNKRFYKINFKPLRVYGTVEFRHHQSTLDCERIKRWVIFCLRIVELSKKGRKPNGIFL
jgi:hypothetical protein